MTSIYHPPEDLQHHLLALSQGKRPKHLENSHLKHSSQSHTSSGRLSNDWASPKLTVALPVLHAACLTITPSIKSPRAGACQMFSGACPCIIQVHSQWDSTSLCSALILTSPLERRFLTCSQSTWPTWSSRASSRTPYATGTWDTTTIHA